MEDIYVYHNWTIGKAIVHYGSCSHCRNGLGKHSTGTTSNSTWYGPFHSKDDAFLKAKSTNEKRIDYCKFCFK